MKKHSVEFNLLIKMKKLLVIIIAGVVLSACKSVSYGNHLENPDINTDKVDAVIKKVFATTCFEGDEARDDAQKILSEYAGGYTDVAFKVYLSASATEAEKIEKQSPIIRYYKAAYNKVLNELRNTTSVAEGSVVIWYLYNMGFIIKTPSVCFGIDISHKYASSFADYLDFYLITHNHSDHYSNLLINVMNKDNKPVTSNYLNNSYRKTVPGEYIIKGCTIKTNINDHSRSNLKSVVTYQIDCGNDTGNMIIMHTGDCGYYDDDDYDIGYNPIDLFIARYVKNNIELNVIGKRANCNYVFLSHILELGHEIGPDRRDHLDGMDRVRHIRTSVPDTYMPMWGDKMIWKKSTRKFE